MNRVYQTHYLKYLAYFGKVLNKPNISNGIWKILITHF